MAEAVAPRPCVCLRGVSVMDPLWSRSRRGPASLWGSPDEKDAWQGECGSMVRELTRLCRCKKMYELVLTARFCVRW